jgi:hypothetical protein
MNEQAPIPELPPQAQDVRCTHCESAEVSLISLFGGSVSECLFECRCCRSYFHWVKWR